MLRRVLHFIERNELLKKREKILVGVSGGADSIALFDILIRGGWDCEVVHCNFHLRGEESIRDEAFVCRFIQDYRRRIEEGAGLVEIGMEVHHFDTLRLAKENGRSVEMEAREERYELFLKRAYDLGCTAIAVGHHANDQVETVLMNMFRGTTIKGLQGMKPKTLLRRTNLPTPYNAFAVPLIRPLLCTTHQRLVDYLQHVRHLDWVEDSTNAGDDNTRARLRKHLGALTEKQIEHVTRLTFEVQRLIDEQKKENEEKEEL